ncbi:hypothetical protein [Jiulongibacter sp. NS-SX5]|uniref:hypothetical protein n=1 Tax=Jiulongibacter sp. NS-SX5 TaxID=3463854 RepID=UPI004059CF3E
MLNNEFNTFRGIKIKATREINFPITLSEGKLLNPIGQKYPEVYSRNNPQKLNVLLLKDEDYKKVGLEKRTILKNIKTSSIRSFEVVEIKL